MTIAEMRTRLGAINDELTALNPEELTDEESARFDELTGEADTLVTSIEQAEAREESRSRIAQAAVTGTVETVRSFDVPNVNTRVGSDPFDVTGLRFDTPVSELRSRAEAAIEKTVGDLDSDMRQSAVNVLRKVKDPSGALARRILATGTPQYRSAAQKLMGGQSFLLDADEQQAVARAQSLTGNAGGFAIPFTLDPTIIYTGDGAANPFRDLCRIETIVTDQWNGVSSAGVTGGYAAEASEVGDDAATLAQPSIDVERWDTFVPFSFEAGQDWANLESDIRMLVMERRDEFDTVAFTTGTGTNEPTGIVTALDGTASEVAPQTAETFTSADVYNLARQLPPKYRRTAAQANWMAELGTFNDIRQFDTTGGNELWAYIGAGMPDRLLGYGAHENSAMASSVDINAAATADNFVLVIGDWRNYLIVDRAGMNFELVPHLFATANNRPSGQRGFLAWGRTGAGCVNTNAFRLLNVATTL